MATSSVQANATVQMSAGANSASVSSIAGISSSSAGGMVVSSTASPSSGGPNSGGSNSGGSNSDGDSLDSYLKTLTPAQKVVVENFEKKRKDLQTKVRYCGIQRC